MQRGTVSFNFANRNGGKGRNGYAGYKWLNREQNTVRNLKLHVAVFGPEYDDEQQRSVIEAIEGELVFLVRQQTGDWPLFQNEIHFRNSKDARLTAVDIWNNLKNHVSVLRTDKAANFVL